MWYDRKSITPEEAEKERKRLIALEERDDDEYDLALIDSMVGADEIKALKDIEDYVNPKKEKKNVVSKKKCNARRSSKRKIKTYRSGRKGR